MAIITVTRGVTTGTMIGSKTTFLVMPEITPDPELFRGLL